MGTTYLIVTMVRFFVFASILAAATAFTTPAPLSITKPCAISPTARFVILSEQETNAIMKSAEECVESECSVDDVSKLVSELKEQEKILDERLTKIMNMVAQLQHLNEKPKRETNEIRQFVRDLLRVFVHEKQRPMGYSGDVGDWPKTAYDALPPKKWKSSP